MYTVLGEASLKKNGKIWDKFPKGGGMKKTDENSQFQFGNCESPGGGSRFFKNVWIRIRLRYNPRNKTKFGLFQSKYTLSKENMTFYIIKKEEYHFILPSQYKYDFLDGYPRGSAGINIKWLLCLKSTFVISEVGLRPILTKTNSMVEGGRQLFLHKSYLWLLLTTVVYTCC